MATNLTNLVGRIVGLIMLRLCIASAAGDLRMGNYGTTGSMGYTEPNR